MTQTAWRSCGATLRPIRNMVWIDAHISGIGFPNRGSFPDQRGNHRGPVRQPKNFCCASTNRASNEKEDDNGRIFSNLDRSLKHEPGSVLGASILCAGTAVGAGILALPAATGSSGFEAAATAITGAAAFSILTGFCVAEVAVNTMCELGTGSGVSLGSMAQRTLGGTGSIAVKIAYVLLHYTLLVAYTAKAGETIHLLSDADTRVADVIFTLCIGGLCYGSSQKQLDAANGLLVTGVVISFLILLFSVSQSVKFDSLFVANWSMLPKSLPVVALSFVFQNVVPVICSSLEGDKKKIRTAILAGISVPWMMFILWTGSILGSAGPVSSADPLDAVRSASQTNAMLIDGFSLLAVSTSYIGFVLGLKEFICEVLQFPANKGNKISYPLVLVPPLVFAACFPDLFYTALEFAGTYGVLVLFGIIPVAMVWSERYAETTLGSERMLPGGKLTLLILGLLASGVILDQAFISNS